MKLYLSEDLIYLVHANNYYGLFYKQDVNEDFEHLLTDIIGNSTFLTFSISNKVNKIIVKKYNPKLIHWRELILSQMQRSKNA